MSVSNKLRIDKYLWAIRIFKTRSKATLACSEGKVKMEGINVKPSKLVQVAEIYDIKTSDIRKRIEVIALLDNRKAYNEAINFYKDITPEEDSLFIKAQASSFHTGKRLSKIGRPTKKERRDLDRYMDT